jgi:hypothetical protein
MHEKVNFSLQNALKLAYEYLHSKFFSQGNTPDLLKRGMVSSALGKISA